LSGATGQKVKTAVRGRRAVPSRPGDGQQDDFTITDLLNRKRRLRAAGKSAKRRFMLCYTASHEPEPD